MSESSDIIEIIREAGEYALGEMGDDIRKMAAEDRPKVEADLRRLAVLQSRYFTRPADREATETETAQLVNALHFVGVRYGLTGIVLARTFVERLSGYLIDRLFALAAKL